jgi:2-polyprenyl-3-methyl-5-hydroxy-6-metoxy-1,4-benzoquinol methylase
MKKKEKLICPICGAASFQTVFKYAEPPQGEIRFTCSSGGHYYREILRCATCSHCVSKHDMDLSCLYGGDYVDSNYGDEKGIERSFNRIISLDASRSDNAGRTRRIVDFAASFFGTSLPHRTHLTLLDVGSGIGVFPYAMKKAGWDCTAVETDERAVSHARQAIGVNALHGEFMSVEGLGRYHLVTFNKVLEHVEDPIAMLGKSRANLLRGGFVYVEVPDGEMAEKGGKQREEFFIDHLHVFSFASTVCLSKRAGFAPVIVERLQEPSSKYTIRAFLIPQT